MTKHLTLLVIATLCASALSAVVVVRMAHAAAGDTYNLGTFGGGYSFSSDINDAGQVVGLTPDAMGRQRAFLWDSSHGMTDLGTANAYTETVTRAINATGSVVGWEYDSETGLPHAFAWTPNDPNGTTGTFTDLPVQEENYNAALGINDAGLVVGGSAYSYSYFEDDGSCTPDNPYYPDCGPGGTWVTVTDSNAVLWENGVGSDLANSSALETAYAINNAGQVTGSAAGHAFRYDDTHGSGVMHDLGTLGGSTSAGYAINSAGQVVGGSSTTGDTAVHAFRYTGTPGAGGVMVDLGALGETSHAYDINDAGFVVGYVVRSVGAGGGYWATLWQNDAGNTAVDLDAWLDAINPTLGAYWALNDATGINNNGLITGQGMYDDGPGGLSDGSRAFVLDASSLTAVPPLMAGDFNGDTIVDAADLASWKGGFGATGNATHTQGDADEDHDVDGADFLVWQRQLGSGPGNPPTNFVPEPVSLTVCGIGALGLLGCRWRLGRHTARELVARRQRTKDPLTKHLTLPGIATLCAIALSAVVGVSMAHAAPGDIYNLGTLGGTDSFSSGINDAGQVAGYTHDAAGRERAFLWDSSHGMTDLGTADDYALAGASAINASGSVVGFERDSETGFHHAFAWTPNEPNGTTGTFTDLAVEGEDYSFALEINDAGHVVGGSTYSYSYFVPEEYCTPDYANYPDCGGGAWVTVTERSAVLWENGVGSNLTNSSALEAANAINDAGQVAGTSDGRASRYDGTPGNGGITYDLGTLGGTTSVGFAINNSGQVVGYSLITGDPAYHAFSYTGTPGAGGVMANLGAPGVDSIAVDINEAGFVVGLAQPSAGGDSWATLWQNDAGNTAVDLDAWLDAINPTLGAYWRLRAAIGINNDGLITGDGAYDDGPGGLTDGTRAFVLDASSLTAVPPLLPGDFNGDRVIDGADLAQWQGDFGVDAGSDADNDLDSDGADFLRWQQQFSGGPPIAPTAAAVPEPASLALATVIALASLARRRQISRG